MSYHPLWQIPGNARNPVLVRGEMPLAAFEVGQRVERDEVIAYIAWVMTMYSPFGEGPLALRHILCDLHDGKHLVRAEKLRKAAAKKSKAAAKKRMPKRAGRRKRK